MNLMLLVYVMGTFPNDAQCPFVTSHEEKKSKYRILECQPLRSPRHMLTQPHNCRGPYLSFPAEDTVSGLAEDNSEVTSTKVPWGLPRPSGGDRAKQGGGRGCPSDMWLLHVHETRQWGRRGFWLVLPPISASSPPPPASSLASMVAVPCTRPRE